LRPVKILAFSDLHRDLEQGARLVEMSAEADVVIGAGDFASVHEGLEETIGALSGIEAPTVLVPGNNETVDALREAAADWSAATVLHGEGTTIEGTEFFGLGAGIPVTPWDWSFDLDDEAATEQLASCPEGAVLVLHSPPKDHCDSAGDGGNFGSPALLRAKRSAPTSRSAATSTSPGAARARSAPPPSATSAPKAPGSRSSGLPGPQSR
jgi:Icc-related predicted phosphoesterase